MLTGQSHVSQGLIVQVPDSGAERHFSANESRHSELLLSSRKGPGVSHAGQDTTACESSLSQSSAGRSVSLLEQALLTQTSGLEYSQPGLVGRALIDREVSSASTIRHTPDMQADAGTSQIAGGHPATFSDETGEGSYLPRRRNFRFSSNQRAVLISFYESNNYPSREQKKELAKQLDTKLNQIEMWFTDRRRRHNKSKCNSKNGNEKKNVGKVLSVTLKRGLRFALLSRIARHSSIVAGLPAETTRRECFRFSSSQLAVLESSYESNNYPSREKKEELVKQLDTELTQIELWFIRRRRKDNKCKRNSKKGNEEKNAERALPVTPKEDSPRALSSRAVCPSIVAGLSAETPRHTPDTQADAGASRVASDHPVTFSDETGEGTHSPCDEPVISLRKYRVLETLFKLNSYPSREEKEAMAGKSGIGLEQINEWFAHWNHQNNACKRSSEKGDEEKNAGKALPVTPKEDSPRALSPRAVCPSIAGSPAETTCHTPDTQADAGARRVASGHPVTFSDEAGEGSSLPRRKGFRFSPDQVAVLQRSFESNRYPSREKKEELARQCNTDLRRVMGWFSDKRCRDNQCKRSSEKGDEEKNTGKALPVTPKEDLPRVLSSRAACPSIAGSPAKKARHTSDRQADASRIVALRSVILSGKMRSLCRPRCVFRFSVQEIAECELLYNATGGYPTREQKDNLANKLGIDVVRIDTWFRNKRGRKRNLPTSHTLRADLLIIK